MKDDKIIEETYEESMKLNVLYEVLDGLYKPTQFNYPADVKESADNLINSLNNYLYHQKNGYDIIGEKYFNVVKYRKNN